MSNMFINTRAVSNKIVSDFKSFSGIYSIFCQLVYLSFLVYSLAAGVGYVAVNVTLTALSAFFLAFLIFSFVEGEALTSKQKNSIKHAYRITTLAVRAVSLGITVYGIHVAVSQFNTASLLFAVFMLFAWLFGTTLEVSRFIIEKYTALMTSALSKDTEPFVKAYRRITFKGYDGRKQHSSDSEVDAITAEYKKELDEKRESEKALKEAEKLMRREERREAFRAKTSEMKHKLFGIFQRKNDYDNDDNDE